ncbi:MAG: hypothetical protein WBQ61_17855 [Candidatus Acidiferrum sp.]
MSRGQNPFQRSARITDELIQLNADGIMRQQISTLNLTEALSTFFEISTPARHVSILVDIPRTPEVSGKFYALRGMPSAALKRPVVVGFGPNVAEHSTYFLRELLPYGLCIIFTTDQSIDKPIPGASYTFGDRHQIAALAEYDTLVQWGRPVLRLHLAPEFSGAFD